MSTKRRNNLAIKGGVELFEVRLVTSIDPSGKIVTNTEVTCPDGTDEPSIGDALEALRQARHSVIIAYEGADNEV